MKQKVKQLSFFLVISDPSIMKLTELVFPLDDKLHDKSRIVFSDHTSASASILKKEVKSWPCSP